jgi:para-aminobenzoate synthetase component I
VSQDPERETPVVHRLSGQTDIMRAVRALVDLPYLLLLESAAVRAERGRYSFLMADPLYTMELGCTDTAADPFAALCTWSNQYQATTVPGLPPFQGGVAGLMSYELGRCWERISPAKSDAFGLPLLSAHVFPWVLAWDHIDQTVWLIAHGWPESDPSARRARAEHLADGVLARLGASPQTPVDRWNREERPLPEWAVPISPGVWSDFTAPRYLAALQRVVEYIHAGDIFQANLTQRLLCRATRPPWELYHELRRCNPAPFAGLYLAEDYALLSASPERFLHIEDGVVATRPIKGTRRRSTQVEADLYTRDSLRQSEKDHAENVMIVDLLRNDLSRVCTPGSVCVPQLCDVETYATVQHLVSEVRGTLEPGRSVWDLFAATFPGGSITGAPKVRAMEIISELEPTVRGPYTGSLFYVSHDQRCDSNLLIRTFVQRAGWLQCGVGGGIVAQSDPATEYEETWHKASAMLRALGLTGP